ncbi:Ldh family oxidoreductase [Acetobacteraceae bacterium H6797]|nr:Ldh family oxidoreductase [Acetobacteraceae bacterium H6797]
MPDSTTKNAMSRFSAETLRAQILAVFKAWGMTRADAEAAAEVMVETDLAGIDSHGIGMLPHYQRIYAEGTLNPRPAMKVLNDRPSTALVDADHGLGHPASVLAMRLAIDKAKATGVGVVGVTKSNHYGAAGWYAQMASKEGLIGLSLTNSSVLAVPLFGKAPMLGTNPIAFGAPAVKNPDFLLDMATTTVAYGKVSIARREGKTLPVGWALNADGQPETDAQVASDERRLAPLGGTRQLGGHKGYGLATMVEILCATLTGADLSKKETGHFFLVIDPGAFNADFREGMDELLDRLRATPRADPEVPVLIPGDPEYASYKKRLVEGIPVTDTLQEEVRAAAEACGAPFLLVPAAAL